MARIALDEKTELGLRAQMYKELAQYVASKRKARKHAYKKLISIYACSLAKYDGLAILQMAEEQTGGNNTNA
jgi:hypothetical protein